MQGRFLGLDTAADRVTPRKRLYHASLWHVCDLLLTAKGRREKCNEALELLDMPFLSLVLEIQLFEDARDAIYPFLLVFFANVHHQLIVDFVWRLFLRAILDFLLG